MAREDAELAVRYGVDGIIVFNHGGHEDASARGTIESLPEVVAGVAGKIPVLIDSGFGEVRRCSRRSHLGRVRLASDVLTSGDSLHVPLVPDARNKRERRSKAALT